MSNELIEGTFRARAKEWGLGETKTGKEQIAVKFVLLDKDGTEGPTITYYGYFTDAAYEYTIKNLRACGWTGNDLTDLSSLGTNEVEVVVEVEEYEGKKRSRVQFINGPGGGMLKAKMDDGKARAFAAKMRSKIDALGVVPKKTSDLPF